MTKIEQQQTIRCESQNQLTIIEKNYAKTIDLILILSMLNETLSDLLFQSILTFYWLKH